MRADRPAVRDVLDRRTALQIGLGFAIAGIVIYLLAAGVGIDRLLAVLGRADLGWVAIGCLSTLVCLTFWARAWQVVLGVLDIRISFRTLVVTYYAATFANYVTPLGQAGGEPFIAWVLSRDTEASYEDSLASVVTADLLNLLPFFTFAGIGFTALLWQSTLPPAIRPLALVLGVLALGIPLLSVLGWRFRHPLGRLVLRVVAPLERSTGLVTRAGVRERLLDLNVAFERITSDRRALTHAVLYSFLGWSFFALPLVTAAAAIGEPITILLVLFIVPASTLAGMLPSPGGLGGVEAGLFLLLVVVAGFASAPALAAALLYRVESYWFGLLLGGTAALVVVSRN